MVVKKQNVPSLLRFLIEVIAMDLLSSLIQHRLAFVKLTDCLTGCGLRKIAYDPISLSLQELNALLAGHEGYIQYQDGIFHFNKKTLVLLPAEQSIQLKSMMDALEDDTLRMATDEELASDKNTPSIITITGNAHLENLPIAEWTESEWGYIRNKGVTARATITHGLKEYFYVAMFAGIPVGMFALFDHAFHDDILNSADTEKLPDVRELMYVYVDKSYRGLGFGKQIIEEAKRIAVESGAAFIQLDTLRPGLNRMYEKLGAERLCEHQLFSHSTDVFTIRL